MRIVRIMNNRTVKIIRLTLAIYLVSLFTIVIPNHHHKDHAEHSDCVVCIIGYMPTLPAISFSLVIIAILLKNRVTIIARVLVQQTFNSFQSRAPPLFSFFNFKFTLSKTIQLETGMGNFTSKKGGVYARIYSLYGSIVIGSLGSLG
jgi:hypothetical protein